LKRWYFFCLTLLGIIIARPLSAQSTDNITITVTLNEICTIGLNDSLTVTLTISPPAAGGENVLGDSDSSKLLQYTSLVFAGTTRSITVNWGSADSAPAGTSLKAEVTSIPSGCGNSTGEVTVSDIARTLITNIGGCHTGEGANGANLTYTFSVDDISQLHVGDNQTVTLTFTLTDAL
jgi:hypothetical protein